MKIIPWKILENELINSGLTLRKNDGNLEIEFPSKGLKESFPFVFLIRTEPSALRMKNKDFKGMILITGRVPLSTEKRLLQTFRGYIDFEGNYALRLNGKLLRHRVPLSKLNSTPIKNYFLADSPKAGKAFRIFLEAKERTNLSILAKDSGLSIGFLSQIFQFMKQSIGSSVLHLPFSKDEKEAFMALWRDSYQRYEDERYFFAGDEESFLSAIRGDPHSPFLLGGEAALGKKTPFLTLLSCGKVPEAHLRSLGLIEDRNGNVRIKKASPYVLEHFERGIVDQYEAYLTSFLPLSENSFQ